MSNSIEHLKGYHKYRTYVIAKHSAAAEQLAQGRSLFGEIPDSSSDQGGTMQVWEVPELRIDNLGTFSAQPVSEVSEASVASVLDIFVAPTPAPPVPKATATPATKTSPPKTPIKKFTKAFSRKPSTKPTSKGTK